ncbi:MAG: PIG-L family deacetylase [Chloroflexus sp.]
MPFVTEQASALPGGYRHIVLSPHLDDAALSCGGLIARATATGEPVLVVNVCSGSPPPDAQFSPFAQALHERWNLPPGMAVTHRRAEDTAALSMLGADALLMTALDAIYRLPTVYADELSLFTTPAADDFLFDTVADQVALLSRQYPRAVFYVPLAVGMHVDHQIVFAAASTTLTDVGAPIAYYEDFPYAYKAEAVEQRLAMIGREHHAPRYIPLDESLLATKISAIAAYVSQMSTLFGDAAAMPATVIEYATRVALPTMRYAERLWVRV